MEFLNKLDVNNSKVTEVATPTSGTDAANKSYVDTGLALKAALASPAFTGVPTAPTAPLGTNNTQVATTAFVLASTSTPSAILETNKNNSIHVWVGTQAEYNAITPDDHTIYSITDDLGVEDIDATTLDGNDSSYFAPINSPTFTGTASGNFTESKQALGTLSTNTTIDCASGSIVTATLGAAITIGITASASTSVGRVCTLILTNGGAYTITWNTAIKWVGGTAPTLTASGIDMIHFITIDNGTTWYGCLGGAGFA